MMNLLTLQLLLLQTPVPHNQLDKLPLVISALSLAVSVGTFIYTMIQTRNQQYQILLNIIFKKAEICNSYIKSEHKDLFPKGEEASISAILSNILTTLQIIKIQSKSLDSINDVHNKSLMDTFYLILHTSIRQYISSRDTFYTNHVSSKDIQTTINKQIQDIRERFEMQIKKYQ